MMGLGSKKLRLSPSKLGAPMESKLIEGFQSKVKVVKVLPDKQQLSESTFLDVE